MYADSSADSFVQIVLCLLCVCSSDHNRIYRPYTNTEFGMIDCSRDALSFSRFTSDRREWKWAFATTTFGLPCLQQSWFESDTCRLFLTVACLVAEIVVVSLDAAANRDTPYWFYTLNQFGVGVTFVYLIAGLLNGIQIRCRYPDLGDRLKCTDDMTFLGFTQYVAFHFGLPFTAAAMGQSIVFMSNPQMGFNNFGILLAVAIYNFCVFFMGAFLVCEHVVDWAKFLYPTILYLVYVGVDVSHPIPINPGYNALWFVVAFVAYGTNRVITRITIRYKDRPERALFVASTSSSQVSQV